MSKALVEPSPLFPPLVLCLQSHRCIGRPCVVRPQQNKYTFQSKAWTNAFDTASVGVLPLLYVQNGCNAHLYYCIYMVWHYYIDNGHVMLWWCVVVFVLWLDYGIIVVVTRSSKRYTLNTPSIIFCRHRSSHIITTINIMSKQDPPRRLAKMATSFFFYFGLNVIDWFTVVGHAIYSSSGNHVRVWLQTLAVSYRIWQNIQRGRRQDVRGQPTREALGRTWENTKNAAHQKTIARWVLKRTWPFWSMYVRAYAYSTFLTPDRCSK